MPQENESFSDLVERSKCKEDLGLSDLKCSANEAVSLANRKQYEENQRRLALLERWPLHCP
jgi:hypothetical protein